MGGFKTKRYTWKTLVTVCVIVVIFLLMVQTATTACKTYYTEQNVTDKVLDKQRVVDGQSSYYLIYTENETFTIQDSIEKWQFYSSDIYGHIEKNKTYTFSVYGWRNGYWSSYRNIVKATEV